MKQLVECIEPNARPARRSLVLDRGDVFVVYVLPLPPDTPRTLRRTVVRLEDDDPPEGARRAISLRVAPSGLVVQDVARGASLEQIRGDLRSQVVAGVRLPTNALYELVLSDGTRVHLGLLLHEQIERGTTIGVAGSGTKTSRVKYATDNVWWLITDSKGIIVTLGIDAWDAVRDRLIAMGVDGRVLVFVGGLVLTGAAAWYAYSTTTAATARADEAETALELAEAAQAASLATELACLEQRRDLVAQLGASSEQRKLAAEMALVLPLAQTTSIELGGTRMAGDELMALDSLYKPNLLQAVVARFDEGEGDAEACLEQDAALGKDLPAYLLTWHPDPALVCPLEYVSEEDGVRRVGRFGLSDRVAREFGAAGHANTGTSEGALDELLGDPRREDRWSAFTLATAYRKVQETVLRTRLTERPPTLPSQSQLWTLALLDAYNRMPSPAGGALDVDAKGCIEKLLRDRVTNAPPAAPGEPLLPDLNAVAAGDLPLVATPTPGCPWPQGALADGADNALRAVARLATVQGAPAPGSE